MLESRLVDDVLRPDHPDGLRQLISDAASVVPDDPEMRRFPRRFIEVLGEQGLLRRRWTEVETAVPGVCSGDVEFGVRLGQEIARQVPAGVSIGASLHTETVLSLLHRFASNPYLEHLRDEAIAGRAVGCIAASEPTGGSDLSGVQCTATPVTNGYSITGRKKYVSMATVADFAVVLCRVARTDGSLTHRTATIVVPMDKAVIVREHAKLGTHCLDTSAIEFEHAVVGEDALLGRRGLGVLNLNYGLAFERLAIAAQIAGGCAAALGLAVEHSQRRSQFGSLLQDHQYLRFRMAEQLAEINVLQAAVTQLAKELTTQQLDRGLSSRIAAAKLVAARSAERWISDSMQVFGGAGYLTAETPLGSFWNDVRVSRIGAGTDEMMLYLVSAELTGEPELYERLVDISS